MDLSRLRHCNTAEAGNKPSFEAGKLYLLQRILEMGRFLISQENANARTCVDTNGHNF